MAILGVTKSVDVGDTVAISRSADGKRILYKSSGEDVIDYISNEVHRRNHSSAGPGKPYVKVGGGDPFIYMAFPNYESVGGACWGYPDALNNLFVVVFKYTEFPTYPYDYFTIPDFATLPEEIDGDDSNIWILGNDDVIYKFSTTGEFVDQSAVLGNSPRLLAADPTIVITTREIPLTADKIQLHTTTAPYEVTSEIDSDYIYSMDGGGSVFYTLEETSVLRKYNSFGTLVTEVAYSASDESIVVGDDTVLFTNAGIDWRRPATGWIRRDPTTLAPL
jgi:hypothetical protein